MLPQKRGPWEAVGSPHFAFPDVLLGESGEPGSSCPICPTPAPRRLFSRSRRDRGALRCLQGSAVVPCELQGCVNPPQPLGTPWTSVSMTPFKLPSPVQGRLLDGSQTGVADVLGQWSL